MEPGEITLLLQRAEQGDTVAAGEILPLVYEELRRLAHAKMVHEVPGQTLQPTALVHEAWLRLGGDAETGWRNRAHFFAAAAEAMRRILIEAARRRHAVRHGGDLQKISANATGFDLAAPELGSAQLEQLNEALDALAAHDARKAEVVKQWYFVGLTLDEVAQVLGITEKTARRDLIYAKAWLFNEMSRDDLVGQAPAVWPGAS